MPDISLESFCSYMEEIGFINIDLLSDFLESYNNFKKKPLQEALFIAMIKFFRDNYIYNEDNLNRLCKRLIESYNKSIAIKKAESIKKLTLIINYKHNTFRSIFLANLKSRIQIENIMKRYVKGYSHDKIRKRKMSRNNSNSNLCSPKRDISETQSYNDYSYSHYSNNNMRFSNKQIERTFNNYNTVNSSIYNNTSGSNLRSNFYNTDKSLNRINSKTNFSDKKILRRKINDNSTSSVFERLNNKNKISKKKSLNNSIIDCIPSKELKEMKELEECTFQPKINYFYSSCNNTDSRHYNTITANTEEDDYENVHDKLFREQVGIKEKKNIKSLEKMISESNVHTFQPYISPISRVLARNSRSRSFNKTLNKSVDRLSYENQNNDKFNQEDRNIFIRNMDKYKQAYEKNKMANYIKRQKELSREHTYSPSINKNLKSKNSNNNPNKLDNYGSYDFSYLNYKILNNFVPKNGEKLPNFNRITGYNSNLNANNDYSHQDAGKSHLNFKRSRSKSKPIKKSNKSRNISMEKSRKNSQNFHQIINKSGRFSKNTNKNLTSNNFKKSNYPQEALSDADFDISEIPAEKRSQSFNNFAKGNSVIYKTEKLQSIYLNENIDNNINLILNQHLNKNRSDNNDYHFNYNFKNDYLPTEDNDFNNLYSEKKENKSDSGEIFDKLYSQAEKIKLKKMILSNEIYSEKYGITFKPKINKNSKYNVNFDFHERDMNFVKTKRENLERLMKESKEKELSIIRKSRTLSKDEKDRNTRSVVERLYKKQMVKLKEIQAKKIEEEKKTEAEIKMKKISKEEIEFNNKKVVQRLYTGQIEKIKEQFNISKKQNNEELQKNLDLIENKSLNKIKISNKKNYSTVQSRVFNVNKNKNEFAKDKNNKNNNLSPSNNRQNSKDQNANLLKKLRKEHKIKFKNEDLSIVCKSKEKNFELKNNLSETRIKKTEDSSPNKNSLLQQDNSKNAFNFADSINSNNNRNSLLQSNSSVGDKLKKSNSKVVKPIRATDFKKKNYSNNSDSLLESNNKYFQKSDSRNSNEENSKYNKKFENKKKSIKKDYANLSPINDQNNHSLLDINALSNKSSFREGEGVIPITISKFESSLNSNSKNNAANNATTYNNSNTKETSVTSNSRNNKYELNNIKDEGENHIPGNSDNSDNSRGIEVKENKFKSKGLEKILSGRK